MKNWKTTLSGLLGAAGLILTQIPKTSAWGGILAAIGAALTGLTAKDNNVTGGTKQQ